MKNKKILNYRPIALSAVAISCGILFAALCYGTVWAFVTFLILNISFVLVSFILRYGSLKHISVFLLIGFVLFSINAGLLTPTKIENQYTVISGRVESVDSALDKNKIYVLKDVMVDDVKLNGKAKIECNESLSVGDIIIASGNIGALAFDAFDSYAIAYYEENVRYVIEADYVKKTDTDKLTIIENIREKIKDVYLEYLGESGGVALGLMVGDVSYMDYGTRVALRNSGIYHIFSVSGMHVVMVAAVVMYLCNLFRIRRNIAFGITVCALALCGIVTAFPVGVVRAVLMYAILLLATVVEKPYDALNTLSLAVIVILLCSPLSLFNISFLLSVGAVFGIICFYSNFKNLFTNFREKPRTTGGKLVLKCTRYIWRAVCISVSANLFVIVIGAYFFQTVTPYFIISNLITAPLVTFIYVLLIPFTLLALIYQPLGILMSFMSIPIVGLVEFSAVVSSLPYAVIKVSLPLSFCLIYALGLTIISKYNMMPLKRKIIHSLTCFIACACIIFIF